MRRLLAPFIIGLALVWAQTACAAITYTDIGNFSTTGNFSTLDYIVTTTAQANAGDVVVCEFSGELNTGSPQMFIASGSDSGSNTWTVETQITSSPAKNSTVVWMWSKLSSNIANGGNIHAVLTNSSGIGYRTADCIDIAGVTGASTSKDQYLNQTSEVAGSPSITPAALGQSVEVELAATQIFLDGTFSGGAGGWTLVNHLSNTNNGAAISYVQTSGSPITYAPTLGGTASGYATVLLLLKLTASGGAVTYHGLSSADAGK